MKQMHLIYLVIITQGVLGVGHVYKTKRWEKQTTISQQLAREYDQIMETKEELTQQLYTAKTNIKKFALNQLNMRALREDQVRTLPA